MTLELGVFAAIVLIALFGIGRTRKSNESVNPGISNYYGPDGGGGEGGDGGGGGD